MKKLLLLCCVLLMMGAALAQDDAPAALVVNAETAIGEVSEYVLGANFGPLNTIPVDLLEAAQNSGINYLRFPGGRWGDLNNIQPQQIDMFIRICNLVGAEPSISMRLENGTPEQAAELVRYTNIEKGYNVRYWSIGNEPNLFDDYTTEDHNTQWRAIAEAMLEVDPDIILIGPDTSQYSGNPATDPRDPEGRDWVREFLLANGDLVDIVAVHRYPFPRSMANPLTTIDDLRLNAPEWSRILPALRAVIEETTGRTDLPVAVTEANSHWSANQQGEATPDSHYNAVWWADVLGRLISDQPFIVNYFDMQSAARRGAWGLLEVYNVRPTYYTYQIYQRFGTTLVESESPDDDVRVYAALREDGALTLVIVNMLLEEQTRTLNLNGFDAGGAADYWLLDPEHNAAEMEPVELRDGVVLALPAQSVSLFILPPA
ncbi:MAG: hypothetical protein OHK0046_25430 [Anaerolineae bacterium]